MEKSMENEMEPLGPRSLLRDVYGYIGRSSPIMENQMDKKAES